jgi:WD40 repeat protein
MAYVIVFALLLVSCAAPPPPAATPTVAPADSAAVSPIAAAPVTATATAVATSPPATVAASPSPSSTAVPQATATPRPTATATPCLDPAAGAVTLPATEGYPPARIFYAHSNQAGIWDEATGTVTEFLLPPQARGATLSPDGRRLAYLVEATEQPVELWARDLENEHERQLATVSIADFLARSEPHVVDGLVHYQWLGDSRRLAYTIEPVLDALDAPPTDAVYVVDATSGETWELVAGHEAGHNLSYSPDGSLAAVISGSEVRLLETAGARRRHGVPYQGPRFAWNLLAFSPDGRYLAALANEGVLLVGTETGAARMAPLAYEPIGVGHGAAVPSLHWSPDGRFLLTAVAAGDDVFAFDSSFTVWQIDVESAATKALHAYQGQVFSVKFSPDRQRLAFWRQTAPLSNSRELYLADVFSGESLLYRSGYLLDFVAWHPDATHFLLQVGDNWQIELGHLCRAPRLLPGVARSHETQRTGFLSWLDDGRFLYLLRSPQLSLNDWSGRWAVALVSPEGDMLPLVDSRTTRGRWPVVQVLPHP